MIVKGFDKVENKIKFFIGVGMSAACLAVIRVVYSCFCCWYAMENEIELKTKEKMETVKEKDENKTISVEDDIVTKEKSFENFIAFPNGTIIDKSVLEKELHLKHLEYMKKLSLKHEIE